MPRMEIQRAADARGAPGAGARAAGPNVAYRHIWIIAARQGDDSPLPLLPGPLEPGADAAIDVMIDLVRGRTLRASSTVSAPMTGASASVTSTAQTSLPRWSPPGWRETAPGSAVVATATLSCEPRRDGARIGPDIPGPRVTAVSDRAAPLEAKQGARGLWSGSFVPPLEWRAGKQS
jgi:hypothetical protein